MEREVSETRGGQPDVKRSVSEAREKQTEVKRSVSEDREEQTDVKRAPAEDHDERSAWVADDRAITAPAMEVRSSVAEPATMLAMRVDPRLGLAALWLGSTLGCTKPEPPVSNADPAPIEQVDAAEPPQPAEAEPDSNSNPLYRDIDLTRDPTQVGADLAARWCALGGDAFRPPPAEPNAEVDVEFPPQLRDCGEVTIEQHRRDERDGIRATHLTIDASSYQQIELVLLQSSEHAAVLELYRDTYDSSGEEGRVSREHYEVELRDVTGTPAPEWIAKLGENGGDSYEADRCYANESDARELILCSESATGFVCAWDSYHSTSTSEPRAKHQLGECDVPAKQLARRSVSGYAMDVEVRRDVVVFSPSETKIHEPEDPPRAGEIAISTLLAEPAELSASAGVQRQ